MLTYFSQCGSNSEFLPQSLLQKVPQGFDGWVAQHFVTTHDYLEGRDFLWASVTDTLAGVWLPGGTKVSAEGRWREICVKVFSQTLLPGGRICLGWLSLKDVGLSWMNLMGRVCSSSEISTCKVMSKLMSVE